MNESTSTKEQFQFPQDWMDYLRELTVLMDRQKAQYAEEIRDVLKELRCDSVTAGHLEEALWEFSPRVKDLEIVLCKQHLSRLLDEKATCQIHYPQQEVPAFLGFLLRVNECVPAGEIWLVGHRDGQPHICRIVNVGESKP